MSWDEYCRKNEPRRYRRVRGSSVFKGEVIQAARFSPANPIPTAVLTQCRIQPLNRDGSYRLLITRRSRTRVPLLSHIWMPERWVNIKEGDWIILRDGEFAVMADTAFT